MNTINNSPLSFEAIHEEVKNHTTIILQTFSKHLTGYHGFEKVEFDTIFNFYEIWFFLLSGVDMRCHSLLKDDEIRKNLFLYLIDKMFEDLDIKDPKVKNIIIEAMNIRLEEYGDLLKNSNNVDEFNKSLLLLFIQKLTHSFMKKEFLNEPSIGLFPLYEGIIINVYISDVIIYMKRLNLFLDSIFETGKDFCLLGENKIKEIKNSVEKKSVEFLN